MRLTAAFMAIMGRVMGRRWQRTGLERPMGRLFARPSFWEGYARGIDLGGTLTEYNKDETGEDADEKAISADWLSVGDSFSFAIRSIPKES